MAGAFDLFHARKADTATDFQTVHRQATFLDAAGNEAGYRKQPSQSAALAIVLYRTDDRD